MEMKNIFRIFPAAAFCLLASGRHAVAVPAYLSAAESAWLTVASGGMGPQAALASRLRDSHASNIATFQDIVSVIAYNESPLTIFEVIQHVGNAFADISNPPASRGAQGMRVVLAGNAFGGMSEFESEQNGDFKTKRAGLHAGAMGYASDRLALGLGFTRNSTDSEDKRIHINAVANSITLFAQYSAPGGAFANAGFNIGRINWSGDKLVQNISDSSNYDTDFLAAQLSAGARFGGAAFLVPQLGARYVYLSSEKHTDQAVQSFDDWSYGSFGGFAGIRAGTEFPADDFYFVPSLFAGGAYTFFSHGNEYIRTELINGQTYYAPVESGARLALNIGAGFGIKSASFSVDLEYKFDYRQEFAAHVGFLNLKLYF